MTYALIICGPCSKDQHEDCGGRKSVLTINGEQFTGACQCPRHSSIRPKVQVQEKDNAINQIARNQ